MLHILRQPMSWTAALTQLVGYTLGPSSRLSPDMRNQKYNSDVNQPKGLYASTHTMSRAVCRSPVAYSLYVNNLSTIITHKEKMTVLVHGRAPYLHWCRSEFQNRAISGVLQEQWEFSTRVKAIPLYTVQKPNVCWRRESAHIVLDILHNLEDNNSFRLYSITKVLM